MAEDPPDRATLEGLAALGTATLAGSGATPLAPRIQAIWDGARVVGPAFGVCCPPGDNLAVHAAVLEAPAGSVLCVEVAVGDDRGFWDEVLTVAALGRGLAGVVVDNGVRDAGAIERRGLPVFGTGRVLRTPSTSAGGYIGATAIVGEVPIESGDIVVGDRDGVVVVAQGSLEATRAGAEERAAQQAGWLNRLSGGATTAELLGLDLGPVHHRGEAP